MGHTHYKQDVKEHFSGTLFSVCLMNLIPYWSQVSRGKTDQSYTKNLCQSVQQHQREGKMEIEKRFQSFLHYAQMQKKK